MKLHNSIVIPHGASSSIYGVRSYEYDMHLPVLGDGGLLESKLCGMVIMWNWNGIARIIVNWISILRNWIGIWPTCTTEWVEWKLN